VTHKLLLLGAARLETPGGTLRLERKTAAVLAYLALEGATPKYRLAGWLWPESGETTARNNMRQLLRRLRLAAGEVVLGEDLIELAPEVAVDVQQLSYLQTPSLELLLQEGVLLEGLEFDDAPDFEEWLQGARADLHGLRSNSAQAEALRLERAGNLRQALEYAQIWARLEPLSEEAHRQVMRLYYLLGDRGAALAAFERLRESLGREFGAQPLPETLELVRVIERGGELPGGPASAKPQVLPTAILRPPLLAGREREWALMEEAWEQGKLIFLSGEAGSGKSRLATDFLASKGKFVYESARPGDVHVPYSTHIRFLRGHLRRYPDYQPPLWVWQALAPWMPELEAGPVAAGPDLPTRFAEASLEVMRQIGLHGEAMVVDDFQFMDDATVQVGIYIFSQLTPLRTPGNMQGFVGCFRQGELSPFFEGQVAEMVASGMAVRIELEPLAPESVERLLEGLGLEDIARLSPGLSRYTGGNPLFVLETLKHLIETGTLSHGLPSRLAPPGKVAALISRRLQRLSPQALGLARAAAVAGTAFDLRLAAQVLERPAMELAEAHAELEAAQILRGNAFTHDLVFEAVLAGVPTALKQVLHGSTARCLEAKEANPARIAQHWLEGGDPAQAAPWLLRAAHQAHGLGLFDEAVRLYQQVLEIAADSSLRLRAQVGLTNPLVALGRLEEAEALTQKVLAQTPDLGIRVKALDALQGIRVWQGRYHEAEEVIAGALPLAERFGDSELTDEMRFSRGFILARLGRLGEALEVLEPLLPRFRQRPPSFKRFHMASTLGYVYVALDRHPEGMALLAEALEGAKSIGSATLQIISANQIQVAHNVAGTPGEVLAQSEEALALGDYLPAQMLRSTLAHGYELAGRPAEAVKHCEWLIHNAADPSLVGMAWARLARVRISLELDHRAALAEALRRFEAIQMPSARLEAVGVALEYGDPPQRAWAKQILEDFDFASLIPLHRAEYERLRKLVAEG
jgi:DNA-binding SARP family transcriptional activator